ncbi:MAG: UDP-N-acetyl-D-glucosamine dehydrogenase [Verrucomicrobia bacterium]|jgi:UDP-N-acetyl-D-glucosamine dehydrogenase|nr:MAG: UDP-N-acetyl-D-glucosamine dehydrogenase [Verrucomicrobiota bacterium]
MLQERIESGEAIIGVIGLGYVGLPIVLNFSARGFQTVGFDIDPAKVDALRNGRSYIRHIPAEEIATHVASGRFKPTTDFALVREADALIICVPTPLSKHHEPDLSYVVQTMETLQPHLRPGQILSLESTTYPGTTAEEVVPRVEARGFRVGADFFVVYSPEREDPGNAIYSTQNIPKLVGGTTPACLKMGELLYAQICQRVVAVSSTQVAEFAKLLENIYRAVNIGLVNEMKVVADRMGVDIWEIIGAAATKPFGYTPFYPGPGLGGHCIPIDPFYLTWKAREYGIHTRFIELAGEINEAMPEYVVRQVARTLNDRGLPVKGSRVLVLGLAYKSNVDDMRESPSFKLLDLLHKQGARVSYHDPYIPVISPTREHAFWTGVQSVPWDEATLKDFDCVVVATWHDTYNLEELASWAPCIVDTRNAMQGVPTNPGQVTKA